MFCVFCASKQFPRVAKKGKEMRHLDFYFHVFLSILVSFSFSYLVAPSPRSFSIGRDRHISMPVKYGTMPTTSSAILHAHSVEETSSLPEDTSSLHPFQAICDYLTSIHDSSDIAWRPEESEPVHLTLEQMKRVRLQDLRVSSSAVGKLPYGVCMTIAEVPEKFEIAAFFLPRGFALPLHDHPNMAVCTKMLMGEAQIRSFTQTKRSSPSSTVDGHETEIGVEADLSFCQVKSVDDNPWVLSANEGNFHEILPLSDCVMLDILLPPYDDHDRNCTFYDAVERSDGKWVLTPKLPEEQQRVRLPVNIPYKGLKPIV